MAEILDVDLTTLHDLAAELGGQTDEIGKLKLTKAVTMPGSPVEGVSTQVIATAPRSSVTPQLTETA